MHPYLYARKRAIVNRLTQPGHSKTESVSPITIERKSFFPRFRDDPPDIQFCGRCTYQSVAGFCSHTHTHTHTPVLYYRPKVFINYEPNVEWIKTSRSRRRGCTSTHRGRRDCGRFHDRVPPSKSGAWTYTHAYQRRAAFDVPEPALTRPARTAFRYDGIAACVQDCHAPERAYPNFYSAGALDTLSTVPRPQYSNAGCVRRTVGKRLTIAKSGMRGKIPRSHAKVFHRTWLCASCELSTPASRSRGTVRDTYRW